ncbi:MAG: hypothetical protein U9M89_01875 [Patescibacteria group bacterium]|nr:hypothetical protein [Patescibacteria group bacterium]
MEVAILVAKLISVIYLFVGLGMLFSAEYYSRVVTDLLHDEDNAAAMYFGGALAAVVGLLIVLNHNVWESSWVVVITIIGWLGLIKGFILLVFPGKMDVIFGSWFNKGNIRVWGFIALLIGLFLGYYGFFA